MRPRSPCIVLALVLVPCLVSASRAGTTNSLLDLSPDGGRLLVGNADNCTVTVVDTGKRAALREIRVGEKPEGVTWIGQNLAAVTIYRESRLVFFDPEDGRIVGKLAVPNEPYGIVTNKN